MSNLFQLPKQAWFQLRLGEQVLKGHVGADNCLWFNLGDETICMSMYDVEQLVNWIGRAYEQQGIQLDLEFPVSSSKTDSAGSPPSTRR